MEPLKIQFEVSLSEATLSGLKEILLTAAVPRIVGSIPPHAIGEIIRSLKGDQATSETVQEAQSASPAPTPAKEDKPVKTAENPSPAPIPDLDLFEAVKAAQKERGVAPDTVRGVFKEFGITTSSECPQERRAELLKRINDL